jgi:hypothetical protein
MNLTPFLWLVAVGLAVVNKFMRAAEGCSVLRGSPADRFWVEPIGRTTLDQRV